MLVSRTVFEVDYTSWIGSGRPFGSWIQRDCSGFLNHFDMPLMDGAIAPRRSPEVESKQASPTRDRGKQLLRTLRQGGDREDVFRQLYELYSTWIRRLFERRGFSCDQSRDLTQETFLRISKGLDDFRGGSRLETWMYEIALNVARNAVRRTHTLKRDGTEVSIDSGSGRQHESDPEEVFDLPAPDRAPLEEALANENRRLVAEELARMPEKMRRCLQLRLHQGLKYREIGVLMKISVNAVKSHLGEGKQRLRRALRDHFRES